MTAVFVEAAEREPSSAVRWYQNNALLGDELIAEVVERVKSIEQNPERFPRPHYYAGRHNVRWAILKRFPCALIFVATPSVPIRIIAFAHLRRRAGYWHRRL